LIIGHLDGDTRYGVNDYIDMIMNRKVTKLTVNWFIKSQIKARDLIEGKSAKKSRKTADPSARNHKWSGHEF